MFGELLRRQNLDAARATELLTSATQTFHDLGVRSPAWVRPAT
jgi:hypothetical protein